MQLLRNRTVSIAGYSLRSRINPSNTCSLLPLTSHTTSPTFPSDGHNSTLLSSLLSTLHHHHLYSLKLHNFSSTPVIDKNSLHNDANGCSDQDEIGEEGESDDWEEENEVEPEIADGGDGGGVVLRDVQWGERCLTIAHEVLLHFNGDMKIYAFKVSDRGYIYVRLDKLSNKYGCPSMEEMETFSCLYKKRLDEVGEQGDIPADLALEVSSPGAERLLKVPDDLERFKNLPMHVNYLEEDSDSKCQQKDGIFQLDSIEIESGQSLWKLANVKENKEALGKGRPLGRKQRDWRLMLPFDRLRRVMLYLDY